MNKINLVVLSKKIVYKSNLSMTSLCEIAYENDTIVSDEIIKYVDCIRDIVL